MNIKRGIGFAFLTYLASIIFVFAGSALLGVPLEAPTLGVYVIHWVGLIVAVLFFAKWYFKKSPLPTAKHGLKLGLLTLLVSLGLDLLSIGVTMLAGESLDVFMQMYSSWEFYMTIVILLLVTTYAGYEFDGTFTAMPTNTDDVA